MRYELSYDYKIKLGDKEIRFRPWTTKEEKNYLLSKDDEVPFNDKEIYDILIKPCLEKPIILDPEESKYVLMKIREVSIGESFEIKFECDECHAINVPSINLASITTFTPAEYREVSVKDVTIKFNRISSESALEKIQLLDNPIDKFFMTMVFSVEKVKYKDEEYESFTADEISDFFDSLPTYIMDKFVDEFLKMKPSLDLFVKTKCHKCKKEYEFGIDSIPNFLWE